MSNQLENTSRVVRAELIDMEDGARIIAYYNRKNDYPLSADGEIHIVTAWNLDDSPYHTDFFAEMFVKWDGCSHFYFYGDDYLNTKKADSYYHICGAYDLVNHMRMLVFAYEVMVEHVGYSNVLEIGELEELRKLNLINEKYQIRYFYDNNDTV